MRFCISFLHILEIYDLYIFSQISSFFMIPTFMQFCFFYFSNYPPSVQPCMRYRLPAGMRTSIDSRWQTAVYLYLSNMAASKKIVTLWKSATQIAFTAWILVRKVPGMWNCARGSRKLPEKPVRARKSQRKSEKRKSRRCPAKKRRLPRLPKKKNNFSLEISRKIKLQWKPT